METFTGFIFLWPTTISQATFFFSIRPNVLCQSCSRSDTLTFLFDISVASQWKLPHERIDISHLSAPLALNEQQRFIYGGRGSGACRWPPIQDPLLNNFSQWEAIDSTVLDARQIRSERHRNDCVNEAQTDCYYQVICCVCCVKIYQLCSKAHLCVSLYFILLFVSS